MQNSGKGKKSFIYILSITCISFLLILVNDLFNLNIPFTVDFLIGFVISLFVFVCWHSIQTKGLKRSLLIFSLSFLIAFSAEALGVNFGLIFGSYHYTPALGISLFGVPLLAALAWEPILYAAFSITDILAPSLIKPNSTLLQRLPGCIWMAVIGALATTAWDMMIDPIAVSEGWWVWHQGGDYMPYVANGVPIQNFLGWLGVAFLINLIYRLLAGTPKKSNGSIYLSVYGPLTLYISLFLTSAGVTISILRHPEIALVGLLAMGPFIAIALTNINLLQRGFHSMLGEGWFETEQKVKTGQ